MSLLTILARVAPQGIVSPDQSALSPNNPSPGTTGPVSLTVDAIIKEQPSWASMPTKNPVEKGATVTDHVWVQPRSLTIDGTISNAVPFTARVGVLASSSNPMKDAIAFIDQLQASGEPFDMVTGLKVYQNYIATRIVADRTAATGNEFKFTMSCEEIVIVDSATVNIPENNLDSSVANSAATQQPIGKQTASTPNDTQLATANATEAETSPALAGAGVVIK